MLAGKIKCMLEFIREQMSEKAKGDCGEWMDEAMGVQVEVVEGSHVRMEWEERERTTMWKAVMMGEEEPSTMSNMEGRMEEET